jgi:hypothetical protein
VQNDENELVAQVGRRFAGQTVRWAEDRSNPGETCIKNYLLEQTPAFPFELVSIKNLLSPLRLPGKAIVYKFPAR